MEEDVPYLVGYALNPKKLRKSEVKISGTKTEWAGGGLADIVEPSSNVTSNEAIRFLPWDSSLSPTAQPSFHVIIHKLTDLKNEEEEEKIKALESYLHTHPQTKIIDPIANVRRVTTRLQTILYLQKSQMKLGKYCPFTQPNYLVISKEMTSHEIEEGLTSRHISFPIICKPLKACGSPDSHSMVIVVRKEDCYMIPRPCIIQQYYDHQGILFKAYVIDQDVMVYRRPSLPNLAHPRIPSFDQPSREDRLSLQQPPASLEIHSLAFDSRYCYPKLENFIQNSHYEYASKVCDSPKVWQMNQNKQVDSIDTTPRQKRVKVETSSLLSSHVERSPKSLQKESEKSVRQVTQELSTSTELSKDSELFELFVATAKELKESFGLTLFGFDVILPQYSACEKGIVSNAVSDEECPEIDELSSGGSDQNKLMVIDINYFPSYKEVKDFPERLKRYLRKKASE